MVVDFWLLLLVLRCDVLSAHPNCSYSLHMFAYLFHLKEYRCSTLILPYHKTRPSLKTWFCLAGRSLSEPRNKISTYRILLMKEILLRGLDLNQRPQGYAYQLQFSLLRFKRICGLDFLFTHLKIIEIRVPAIKSLHLAHPRRTLARDYHRQWLPRI